MLSSNYISYNEQTPEEVSIEFDSEIDNALYISASLCMLEEVELQLK